LIDRAKSTDAADRRRALLPGEKAAIRAAQTVIDGAPSSIIAGQSGGWRLRQDCRHHDERRYNLSSETHPAGSPIIYWNNTVHPSISPSGDV
jgi:hypothetical protein